MYVRHRRSGSSSVRRTPSARAVRTDGRVWSSNSRLTSVRREQSHPPDGGAHYFWRHSPVISQLVRRPHMICSTFPWRGYPYLPPHTGRPGTGTPPSSTLGGASLGPGQRVRLPTPVCPVRLWLATDGLSTLMKSSLPSARCETRAARISSVAAEWTISMRARRDASGRFSGRLRTSLHPGRLRAPGPAWRAVSPVAASAGRRVG
jgi:hypothetical protein